MGSEELGKGVEDGVPLRMVYRNYRGEVAERCVLPRRVWFGATAYHPEPQWLMEAWDVEKQALRDFALRDVMKVF